MPLDRNSIPRITGEAYVRSIRPGKTVEWSIGDLLRIAAREHPERTALLQLKDPATGHRPALTYAQLLERAESVADVLLNDFAVGERIAIWASNRIEWEVVQLGAAVAGLIIVAINPASLARELEYMLKQSGCAGIVYNCEYRGIDCEAVLASIRGRLPALRKAVTLESWSDLGRHSPSSRALPAVDPRQPAMIQYTSGTTGRPKGVLLSHYSLVNTIQFVESAYALPSGSIWLNPAPMYSTSGCVFAALSAIWNRGTHLLLPHFDAELVLRGIEEEHANWLPMVPTMAVMLLEHPALAGRNLSSLIYVAMGGSPVPPELIERVERELKADFIMSFGQTESSGAVCMSFPRDSLENRTTTIGYPLAGMEFCIIDPATGAKVKVGEIGEICMRGHAPMIGYFEMPEETAKALDAEGWLHTGDLGSLTEFGYVRLTGRLKDLIIRGGVNIYPREIEDVLFEHPSIAQAAVFGLPDAKWGEIVAAAVRFKNAVEPPTAEELKDFVSARISRHKVPYHIWPVHEFPLTASGKIQKNVLKERCIESLPAKS